MTDLVVVLVVGSVNCFFVCLFFFALPGYAEVPGSGIY